ncbi:MAG: IS200/IS605 family element transposase accessory protein TnpB [Gammaproteobacteria bacterium]|nr:IS200/IS605 family element transposase accessory protein TnpB [Gammaproteobacteria bacterium]MYH85779.1 IS200/IS605 family element transposase accessory protein TnpB [Gammaproteobacteria bacterium]
MAIRVHSRAAKLSSSTHRKLNRFLFLSRQLYNAALDERINAHRKAGESIGFYDQCKSLTEIRRDMPEFANFNATAFRSVLNRLDHSFKRFFAHGGFPRFKGRNRGIRSFEVPAGQFRIRQSGKRHAIHIKGFGRFVVRDVPEGTIRLVRVVQTPIRVKLQFVTEYNHPSIQVDTPFTGIDLGVEKQATLSTGESLPKIVIDDTRRKRLQRRLSKAKKGSNGRAKKRLALAREAQRIAERQRNAIHRITTGLVRKYGANWVVENLNVKGMTASGGNRKRGLNRNILAQQWGTFVNQLVCKAERAGGEVRRINPAYTSKTCSECGTVNETLKLSDRTFDCLACGHSLDRDLNAAINIRNKVYVSLPGGDTPGARPDVVSIGEVSSRTAQNSMEGVCRSLAVKPSI